MEPIGYPENLGKELPLHAVQYPRRVADLIIFLAEA
jgi:hypothetical protein